MITWPCFGKRAFKCYDLFGPNPSKHKLVESFSVNHAHPPLKAYQKLSSAENTDYPFVVNKNSTLSAVECPLKSARREKHKNLKEPRATSTRSAIRRLLQITMRYFPACFTRQTSLTNDDDEVGDQLPQVPPSPPPSVPTSPDLQMIQAVEMRSRFENQLSDILGNIKARELIENSVRRWEYAILSAEGDDEAARQVHDSLQRTSEDMAVTGRWDIRLGDNVLACWERMISSSMVVVVLISRAFFQDRLLHMCVPEIMASRNGSCVVPLYLEEVREDEMPGELRPLLMLQGLHIYHQGLEESVGTLVRWSPENSPLRRYLCEIQILAALLQDISLNPHKYL